MMNWLPIDSETDHRLVLGLIEGNEGTFATICDIYVERLYDYCVSLTQDPQAAADIVHDTFVDAFRRAPRMRNRGLLCSWLYAAARRRCLVRTRNRGHGLYWVWSGEAVTGIDPESGLPLSEVRPVLEGVLERLEFSDQETLLLELRHGVTGEDLAAVLGMTVRRGNAQAARARSLAESAITEEVLWWQQRCASGQRPDPPAKKTKRILPSADDSPDGVAEHIAACPDCLRRSEMTAFGLLRVPPVPLVPAGLRHRVMHTGTDPELAGYRTEIAARGGHLTPHGMPRQPGVPPLSARKWIFTAGGVAGALVSTLVAASIIGPGLPNSQIELPWQHRPSTRSGTPSNGHQPVRQPAVAGGQTPVPRGQAPVAENQTAVAGGQATVPGGQTDPGEAVVTPPNDHPVPPTPTPKGPMPGSPPPPPPPPPLVSGQLVVGPSVLTLQLGHQAYVELSALRGPVTWSAASSNGKLTLAAQQGAIGKGGTYKLGIMLKRMVVQLPGQAVITFTSPDRQPQNVKVTWGLSLLQS